MVKHDSLQKARLPRSHPAVLRSRQPQPSSKPVFAQPKALNVISIRPLKKDFRYTEFDSSFVSSIHKSLCRLPKDCFLFVVLSFIRKSLGNAESVRFALL